MYGKPRLVVPTTSERRQTVSILPVTAGPDRPALISRQSQLKPIPSPCCEPSQDTSWHPAQPLSWMRLISQSLESPLGGTHQSRV
eukprot:2535795-Rhodomonas_salina.2